MADIKTTEGEFRSEVISWINKFLEEGSYPFERITEDPSIKISDRKSRFPDIELWLNRKAKQGFCSIELKTPETPADDSALLEVAVEKARAMNADYFVTWNMRDTIIWQTPPQGKPITREFRKSIYPSLGQIAKADDLWDKWKNRLLEVRAFDLLNDLSHLQQKGHLYEINVDATFFVKILSDAVEKIAPLINTSLLDLIGKDASFRKRLTEWALKQCIANYEDPTFYDTVSRQIVYRLIGKILFYQTLMRFRSDLPKMDLTNISLNDRQDKLKELFEKARIIDYQAVFEEDLPDQIKFSDEALQTLTELIDKLNKYNFSHMPQDVVGQVFEKLIPPEERHALGQYFTREDLVDLINTFCIQQATDKILDPTCGSGTFLIRAYDRLRYWGEHDHKKLLSQLWGIDIARFPAALATINLYRQNLSDYANFPRIIAMDTFDVKANQEFEFPPPKPTPGVLSIKDKFPIFDGMVGNFPFIRQELIERQIKGYKHKLEQVLTQDWKMDYPEAFSKYGLRLSGQADIYAYLFFHTSTFLKEGGRMGFITSNAWLDVAYSYELQKFFLKNFKIIAILESRSEPWFEDVSVNTIVTILERCKSTNERHNHLVKFVKIKKRLSELIKWDIHNSQIRWQSLDRLIINIEGRGKEFLKLENDKIISTLKGIKTFEDEDFRIRTITQKELLDNIESSGKTEKWGQYLRAPEVYFEILEKCKDKLMPLKEVAEVTRGVTTNNVKFFYLQEDVIKHWNIEKRFLIGPVIYTPKEVSDIKIDTDKLKYYLFVCDIEKKKLAGTHALKYIEEGEQKGYHRSLTFGTSQDWYKLKNIKTEPCSLFYAREDDSFRVPFNPKGYVVNDNLYRITPKKVDNDFLCAVLNSMFYCIGLEINGRINLGDGALKLQAYEVENIPIVDIRRSSPKHKKEILNAFEILCSRPIKSIFEEVKMKDRQELDSLILEALGLEPRKYLQPLYDELCKLVRERINLAKVRKKVRQVKVERDVEKLKEQVINEILPEGPKKFPEEFLPRGLKQNDFKEISIPGELLKLGDFFMGTQDVISGNGFKYKAKSEYEAKYIVYAQKPDTYVIKIPHQHTTVVKTVTDYKRYLRSLKEQFFKTFFERVIDHKLADILTQKIFEELKLPEI